MLTNAVLYTIQQDNWQQGRKKAVWLSVSSDLKHDAARDFADIRAKIPCFALSEYGYTKLTEKSGCIFVTYRRVILASCTSISNIVHIIVCVSVNISEYTRTFEQQSSRHDHRSTSSVDSG
jgi:P-loop containing NTP hydrolase pore-1